MSGLRVVSFDFGLRYTGCVMADIDKKRDLFEIVSIGLIEVDNEDTMYDKVMSYIESWIEPQLRIVGKGSLILYENIFNRYTYPNWKLQRIQKDICRYFSNKTNVRVRSLHPTQKAYVGGSKENRKDKSIEGARKCLLNCGCTGLLDIFESFTRKHDVADALLALRYVYDHELFIDKYSR